MNRPLSIASPAIAIGNGTIDLMEKVETEFPTTMLGFAKGVWEGTTIYDSAGYAWKVDRVVANRRVNGLMKILAYVCYNPGIRVRLEFSSPRSYEIAEIQAVLGELIDRDDDCLTQRTDAATLKQSILRANTLSGLIQTLKRSGAL